MPSVLNPNCSFCNFPSLASFYLGYSHIFCKLSFCKFDSLLYSILLEFLFSTIFYLFPSKILFLFLLIYTSMLCFPFLLLPESFIFFQFLRYYINSSFVNSSFFFLSLRLPFPLPLFLFHYFFSPNFS